MGKNIDGITRTASALTGTERFALRDGVANPAGDLDAKGTVSQIATYMASGVLSTYISGLITTARRGTIQLWGAAAAPTGALLCDGTSYDSVANTEYAGLYAIIGTTFGGTGADDFNVPNFQGVVPKGVGSQTINTRSKSGPSLGALQEDQMQGHYHRFQRSVSSTFSEPDSGQIQPAVCNLAGDGGGITWPTTDGTNGTPRTGETTQENCLGINFIIWY